MTAPPPVRHLPNLDLLTLLLGEEDAGRMLHRPLAEVFSLSPGLTALQEGQAVYGPVRIVEAAKELMTRALAETMRQGDCLSNPATVKDFLRLRLAGLEHEVFAVLMLDAQNRLIDAVDLFRGTLTQTSVYPREVVKIALQRNAAAVVFSHNHPSGLAEPSSADEMLTRTLKSALALVDVKVLDHIIVAGSVSISFAERGLI